ncbi:MAG: hypothetical protein A2010_15955 [Nitrospirae bacterium GWD2_57_9]|nr:MAG: hypothetical protein A2010_15955 [Nitrospirae bacterium GWD2_57_9]
MFQIEANREIVHFLHRFDRFQSRKGEEFVIRIEEPLPVPNHRIGIERRAVVKFHPLAQRDRPILAVLGRFGGQGQFRHQVPLCIRVEQPLLNRHEHRAVRNPGILRLQWIKAAKLQFHPDRQVAAGLGLGCRRALSQT